MKTNCPNINKKLIDHLKIVFKESFNSNDVTLIQKLLIREGSDNVINYLEHRYNQQENSCIQLMK